MCYMLMAQFFFSFFLLLLVLTKRIRAWENAEHFMKKCLTLQEMCERERERVRKKCVSHIWLFRVRWCAHRTRTTRRFSSGKWDGRECRGKKSGCRWKMWIFSEIERICLIERYKIKREWEREMGGGENKRNREREIMCVVINGVSRTAPGDGMTNWTTI